MIPIQHLLLIMLDYFLILTREVSTVTPVLTLEWQTIQYEQIGHMLSYWTRGLDW
jgi:hypothetical protein